MLNAIENDLLFDDVVELDAALEEGYAVNQSVKTDCDCSH